MIGHLTFDSAGVVHNELSFSDKVQGEKTSDISAQS